MHWIRCSFTGARRQRPPSPAAGALCLFVMLTCLALAPRVGHSQIVFTDVTTPVLADTLYATDKKGVSFVDFDGDGDVDICVARDGPRAISLYRNNGGVFTDVTSGALAIPGSGSGQTWGDYDGDGDLDLFVSIEEAPPHLFRNDGGTTFTEVTSGPLTAAAHGHSTSWVDYDRDGDLDLFVANLNQSSKLFRNEGGGVLIDATPVAMALSAGDGVAWGDYDNDGDPDLYLARFSLERNHLYRNDRVAGFVDVTYGPLASAANGHAAAWVDYDNDGDLDVFVADAGYPNLLLRNDEGGAFADVTAQPIQMGWHSVGECWGDFDNDGWLDLYVTSNITPQLVDGEARMFHNQGNGTFTEVAPFLFRGTGTSAGVASGDYDGDGDLDLYISSYLGRPNKLLRNDLANGNHWLELDLTGTVSNRSAIGARIELTAGSLSQTREISACTGFRGQNALTAHFGLGGATVVKRIDIRWPSGIVQETTLVAVNRRIHLYEHATPVAGPGPAEPPSRAALHPAAPNPFQVESRIAYDLVGVSPVRLDIRDLHGRRVRTLEARSMDAGRHVSIWDGRDDRGRPVPEGVYFSVLEAGGVRVSERLVRLR